MNKGQDRRKSQQRSSRTAHADKVDRRIGHSEIRGTTKKRDSGKKGEGVALHRSVPEVLGVAARGKREQRRKSPRRKEGSSIDTTLYRAHKRRRYKESSCLIHNGI